MQPFLTPVCASKDGLHGAASVLFTLFAKESCEKVVKEAKPGVRRVRQSPQEVSVYTRRKKGRRSSSTRLDEALQNLYPVTLNSLADGFRR